MRVAAALFGVSRYASEILNDGPNRLQYAATDVQSFGSYVRAAWAEADSLTVHLATDASASSDSFRRAMNACQEAKPDLFICYLAGHAVPTNGDRNEYLFCLHDAEPEDGGALGTTSGIDIDQAFERVGAHTSILFLDCCHAEGIVAGSNYFNSLNGDRARLFFVSTRRDQRAWEDDSVGHGLFSNALMRGLADGSRLASLDGFVDLETLFANVSEIVAASAFSRKSGARQEPVRGGTAAVPIRLPTASFTVFEDQISTHQALVIRFRRGLKRALLIAVAAAVVSDLSLQHLSVDADGDIVARSGPRFLDPVRRIIPGGIVDTGFDADDIRSRESANGSDYDALRDGRLLVIRLRGLDGWPSKLAPLLTPRTTASLSLLITGELPNSDLPFDSFMQAPPLNELSAVVGLTPGETPQSAAPQFTYGLPDENFDCAGDISHTIDFSHLNPGTPEILNEIDWRMARAGDRSTTLAAIARIVAYRLHVVVREGSFSDDTPSYDPKREFSGLAAWTASGAWPELGPGDWCRPAALLLSALGPENDVADRAERELIQIVGTFDLQAHGDAAPPEVEIALFLLEIIGRHRPLKRATINEVARIFRLDERGLDGTPVFAEWLSAIAPFATFPIAMRDFLIDALNRPESEFEFRQVTAFEILSRQSPFLRNDHRELLLAWRRDNQDEFGTFDSFAAGVSSLAPYMPEEEVRWLVQDTRARSSVSHAYTPPAVTWRGDTLIAVTDLAEWKAIASLAKFVDLPPDAEAELIAYAAIAPEGEPKTTALLAVAHQNKSIRHKAWRDLRHDFERLGAEASKRRVLAAAAATSLCVGSEQEWRSGIEQIRAMWAHERSPIVRLELARTLQGATLCKLTGSLGAWPEIS